MPTIGEVKLGDKFVQFVDFDGSAVKIKINTSVIESWQRTWVKTPGFAALRAAGTGLPDNAYSYEKTTVPPTSGTGRDYYGRVMNLGPYACLFYDQTEFSMGNLTNDLNKKLINKAKGNQWNVPIFAAEAGKTANMVIARATHLATMAHDLRRGRIGDFFTKFHHSAVPPKGRARARFDRDYGRNAKEAASNAWLEYSYGWVPFMGDVRSAVNTLMDAVERPQATTTRVKAKLKSETTTVTDLILALATDNPYGVRVYGRYVKRVEQSYKATWSFRPTPADLPGRFGLLNPLEVVWELVPFSFVADWFLPIGDYLSALDVPLRFQHMGGSYGTRVYAETSFVPEPPATGFPGSSKHVRVTRRPMGQIPEITITGMKFSGITDSIPRMLSSIALLGQQVAGLSPKSSDLVTRRPPRTSRRRQLTAQDWYG